MISNFACTCDTEQNHYSYNCIDTVETEISQIRNIYDIDCQDVLIGSLDVDDDLDGHDDSREEERAPNEPKVLRLAHFQR